ncbi:ABC transporter ATP-binding protein [Actinoplanes rectilineatus]|uniref:ABC transporter ATP-binding protein n=1 Tax=Actinoplanes rectilineatus TaxID=113571 RepID=UPI0005F2DB9E|nr:ABC transporter ATP-binding protein [Actinoplanes rectilineatus]
MGLLVLEDLGRSFGPVRALHGVSLTVAPGTVHCVLGENGAGKSTLCNLVYGGFAPTTGTMTLRGRRYRPGSPAQALAHGVAMVHQHFSLVPTMTVEQNLLLGGRGLRLRKADLGRRLERIAGEFGLTVPRDALVGDLPIGARQRVEIVKALLPGPDLVLLDEPTAVLDGPEIEALIATCRAVAASGRSVVLVTHKLGEVAAAADEATVLRSGTVAGGGPLAGDASVPRLLALMLGRDPDDLDPAVTAGLGVRVDVATGDATDVDAATGDATVGDAAAERAGGSAGREPVLRVEGITLGRAGRTRILADVSLTLAPGEIVGIAGVEGNGQSDLVHVLSGATRADAGTVHLGGVDITRATPARRTALGLGVVPEDRHHEAMVGAMSVAENLYLARLGDFRRFGLLDRRRLDTAAADVIASFDIRTSSPRTPMGSLSGGNQQKVVLAREVAIPGLKVLIAAQPTRGLDVGAVDHVLARLRAVAAGGVAVLVVSSELPELLALCDRIHVAYSGRLLGPVPAGGERAADEIGALMTGAGRSAAAPANEETGAVA